MTGIKQNNTKCAPKPTCSWVLQTRYKPETKVSLSTRVMLHYVAMGRFLLVKSIREILNGIAHVAITFTTLKAEKVT